MDDREDPQDLITMEAMSGLAKVFEKIEESCVRPILINISLRIRPCFEKVCGVGEGKGKGSAGSTEGSRERKWTHKTDHWTPCVLHCCCICHPSLDHPVLMYGTPCRIC